MTLSHKFVMKAPAWPPRGAAASASKKAKECYGRARARNGSGGNGPVRVANRIVGFADLILGDRVEPVLASAGGSATRAKDINLANSILD